MSFTENEDYGRRQVTIPTCNCFQWREQHPTDSSGCPACVMRACLSTFTIPQTNVVQDMADKVRDQVTEVLEALQASRQEYMDLQTQLDRYTTQEIERISTSPRIDPRELQQRVLGQISTVKEEQQLLLRAQLNTYLLLHGVLLLEGIPHTLRGMSSGIPRQNLAVSGENLRQVETEAQEQVKMLQIKLKTLQMIITVAALGIGHGSFA
ncbi:hypothetical protein LA080_006173 [Diaporthe eres]|nr:hypothetical protein LA080_006173 [Diaporthe eres]